MRAPLLNLNAPIVNLNVPIVNLNFPIVNLIAPTVILNAWIESPCYCMVAVCLIGILP